MPPSKNKTSQPYRCDRRQFLKLSALIGCGLSSTAVLPSFAQAFHPGSGLHTVKRNHVAMGTFVSLTLLDRSRDRAEQAAAKALDAIHLLESSLTRYAPASPISVLNREGRLGDAPPEVLQVVGRALDFHRITEGRFDISIQPVVDLMRDAFRRPNAAPPSDAALAEATRLVGAERIQLSARAIRFTQSGMGVTLDGIAKGYIVDRAAQVLEEAGIAHFLVNAGGDIRVKGSGEKGRPWQVAIQDPFRPAAYGEVLRLGSGAIATSGNYEVYFDHAKLYHHIVNPRDGHCPASAVSVSVIAPTAMDADALSTAVFTMEPAQGMRFLAAQPHCAGLAIGPSGRTWRSRNWPASRA